MNKHVEGYWWSKTTPEYPMPIVNQLTESQAVAIHAMIIAKQKLATQKFCKGFSHSRIDGTTLGHSEYWYKDWIWTGDLADHYVLKHKVKPSDAFLKFLLDK